MPWRNPYLGTYRRGRTAPLSSRPMSSCPYNPRQLRSSRALFRTTFAQGFKNAWLDGCHHGLDPNPRPER